MKGEASYISLSHTKNFEFYRKRGFLGKISKEDFWSPPAPPPLSDRFCKKSEKIRIDSEWPNSARNRKKKLPLGDPPQKKT